MANRISYLVTNIFRIRPEDKVPASVAKNFRHNAIINTLDISFFFMSDSFWNINTIMPVFAATLTDNPFIIGLMPAIVNAGWFLPQMFLASRVTHTRKILPLSIRLGVAERIPYVFFPFLALAIPNIGKSTALILLILLTTWRGIAGGMSALPWQEVMARVIPISHRGRFFGFSRVFGQGAGILGSVITGLILANLSYPRNYALGFAVAVIIQWLSFVSYIQNREPEPEQVIQSALDPEPPKAKKSAIDFSMFGRILKKDANFRLYLIARSISFIGNMATAFIAVYAIKTFNLPDEQAAIFTGVILASGVLGYAFWGAVGDRIGPKKIMVLSFICWFTALLVAIMSKNIWLYYLVFALFGLYHSGVGVGDSMLIMELGEESLRPTYLGMGRTLTGSFLLLAPVLAGLLVAQFDYNVMFVVSAFFIAIATLLMIRVKDIPRG
ncbi:MAG TPA: MFS transporter [Anaerolineaceae bacterium]|jgi:MFS family permease|nr:MFS transporter [Anaerolineaceae bacterium]